MFKKMFESINNTSLMQWFTIVIWVLMLFINLNKDDKCDTTNYIYNTCNINCIDSTHKSSIAIEIKK